MSNPILPPDDVLHLDVCGSLAGSLGVGLDELDSEDVTLVTFVLDMSSSMDSVAAGVIDAYNTEIQALRLAKTASAILVSTATFADAPALLHGYAKIESVARLTPNEYRPNGSTALHDAVLSVLTRLEAYRQTLRDNGIRSRGIVVVLSDGEDNVSKASAADVRRVTERLVREESTTLAYVGFGSAARGAALDAIAKKLGFPHVLTATQTTSEIRRALGQVSASIVRTTRGGAGASRSFF